MQRRLAVGGGAADGELDRSRGEVVAAESLGSVGDDLERTHRDPGIARLAGDALRLVGGGLRDTSAEKPLGAIDALGDRQLRDADARAGERAETIARPGGPAAGRHENLQLAIRGHRSVELAAGLARHAE